jgi:hypothetical protein
VQNFRFALYRNFSDPQSARRRAVLVRGRSDTHYACFWH